MADTSPTAPTAPARPTKPVSEALLNDKVHNSEIVFFYKLELQRLSCLISAMEQIFTLFTNNVFF